MPSLLANNPWIGFQHSSPSAQVRLFCFPYAGAGASVFRTWPPLFPLDIEVCGVQYPGREHRLNEVPWTDVRRMTEALATELSPHLNTPFAFFGHSLGALVAYELTRVLGGRRMELPVHLFVSGRQAPHLASRHVPLHPLSDSQFIARMRQLNAIPAEAVDNSELLSLLLSILRADFTMGESYTWTDGPPLPVPLSVFGGAADSFMTFEDLTAWRSLTTAPFKCKYFSGGHLFLHSCRRELIEVLIRHLRKSALAISR